MNFLKAIFLGTQLFFICFLGLEKIKLSFEIRKLNFNQENLKSEFEDFKDINLKLITQLHTDISPAIIERKAKEILGMVKKAPVKIINYRNEED